MAAEIPDGAVIVARALMNSSLWEMRAEDRIVALACIVLCNKKPKKWFDGHQQIVIDRGQFVASVRKMVKAAKLPMQVVRTSLEHLEKSTFLTRKSTQGYTVYTVPKYSHYQDLTKYSDSGVRKPTHIPTHDQHTLPSEINTEFAQSLHNGSERNEMGSKDLRKVSTTLLKKQAANQHTKNGKSNIKQQQQTLPQSFPNNSGRMDGRGAEPVGAVVVVQNQWPDPILARSNFRISSKLLEEVKMADAVARALAASKPVGQVLRVVQQARLQKKPGGWARVALENDWAVPEATGDELAQVIESVKSDTERLNVYFMNRSGVGGVKMNLPAREPGEDERSWMRRVTDELNRRKAGQGDGGGGPKKAP